MRSVANGRVLCGGRESEWTKCLRQRQFDRQSRARSGARLDLHLPAELGRAFTNADQPEPEFLGAPAAVGVEADAIVFDTDADRPLPRERDVEAALAASRVMGDVGQRFLHDAVYGQFELQDDAVSRPVRPNSTRMPWRRPKVRMRASSAAAETEIVEEGRMENVGQITDRVQRAFGDGPYGRQRSSHRSGILIDAVRSSTTRP